MSLSAADRLQLRALSDRYATAADARDLAGLQACFLPDGLLQVALTRGVRQEYHGHAELAAVIALLDPLRLTMHAVTTWSLTAEQPHPSAVVYCCAHHVSVKDSDARDLVMQIRYDDSYARNAAAEWCFRERIATVLFTELVPVRLPGGAL